MVRNLIAIALVLVTAGAGAAGDVQAFLRVDPIAGESKTTKSGGGNRGILGLSTMRSQNTSKTTTRNMKWNCQVRYRGKPRPEKVEVKVWYIGYEGKTMTPKILGSDVKKLELDENGKASVELESPTVRLSKTRSTVGGFGGGRNINRIPATKTKVSGQRMAGCVVQLWEGGKLVKSYASLSQWDQAAKDEKFSDESLSRKDKNRLN